MTANPVLAAINKLAPATNIPFMNGTIENPLTTGTSNSPLFFKGIAFSNDIRVPRKPPTIMAPWLTAAYGSGMLRPNLPKPARTPTTRFTNANAAKNAL